MYLHIHVPPLGSGKSFIFSQFLPLAIVTYVGLEMKLVIMILHDSFTILTPPLPSLHTHTHSSDKVIKEVKERLLKARGNPGLEKVDDVNVLCGVVKDFLRSLREPVLTFRLHKNFMQAAGEFMCVEQ